MGKKYLDEDFALKPTFGDLVQIHNFFWKNLEYFVFFLEIL